MSARLSPADVEHVAQLWPASRSSPDEVEQLTEQLDRDPRPRAGRRRARPRGRAPDRAPAAARQRAAARRGPPVPRPRRGARAGARPPRTAASGSRGSWARHRDGTGDRRRGPRRRAVRRGRSSRSTSRRSTAREPELHAFNLVHRRGRARGGGRRSTRRSRGARTPGRSPACPVALKDNLCTRGVATTCSSKILEGWEPPYTATVVDRVLDAGGIPIGKTNLDEFAMGSSTENSAFGATRNPHDTSRVPAGRAVVRRPRSRRGSRRSRSARTPADRSASPPRCAGSSGSSRPTAASRATA